MDFRLYFSRILGAKGRVLRVGREGPNLGTCSALLPPDKNSKFFCHRMTQSRMI